MCKQVDKTNKTMPFRIGIFFPSIECDLRLLLWGRKICGEDNK
jgi:hypothetical protein